MSELIERATLTFWQAKEGKRVGTCRFAAEVALDWLLDEFDLQPGEEESLSDVLDRENGLHDSGWPKISVRIKHDGPEDLPDIPLVVVAQADRRGNPTINIRFGCNGEADHFLELKNGVGRFYEQQRQIDLSREEEKQFEQVMKHLTWDVQAWARNVAKEQKQKESK